MEKVGGTLRSRDEVSACLASVIIVGLSLIKSGQLLLGAAGWLGLAFERLCCVLCQDKFAESFPRFLQIGQHQQQQQQRRIDVHAGYGIAVNPIKHRQRASDRFIHVNTYVRTCVNTDS